jgi:hypothetical protein
MTDGRKVTKYCASLQEGHHLYPATNFAKDRWLLRDRICIVDFIAVITIVIPWSDVSWPQGRVKIFMHHRVMVFETCDKNYSAAAYWPLDPSCYKDPLTRIAMKSTLSLPQVRMRGLFTGQRFDGDWHFLDLKFIELRIIDPHTKMFLYILRVGMYERNTRS